ncbi:MAG: hypothetical protein S4CHLAM7_09100 [Chlamydiae bacterium]|nr:hypothetical protein [Chlamydiota bacterium]
MKKINYRAILVSIIFLSCFTNCTFTKNVAPDSLKNRIVSFYLAEIGGAFDADILHKNLVYRFYSNGSYKTTMGGQFFQAGDYSYKYSNNEGRLLITYSDSNSIFEYQLILFFETSTSGTWSGIYSDNPGINKAEGGTFEFKN